MKKIIFLFIILFTFSLTALPANEMYYVVIDYLTGQPDNLQEEASAMHVTAIGVRFQEDYYISKTSVGIHGGSLLNNNEDLTFEMPAMMRLIEDENGLYLQGVIYVLNYGEKNQIIGGDKIHFKEIIELGKPFEIDAATHANGEVIVLRLSVYDKKPIKQHLQFFNGISLLTQMLIDGKPFSSSTNSKNRVNDTTNFRTGFGLPSKYSNLDNSQQLFYKMQIILEPLMSNLESSTNRKLTFNRTYYIDTNSTIGDEFDTNLVFTSQYSKNVNLRRGKMIQLIFPPDSPAVHNFDIEDTLIIIPR